MPNAELIIESDAQSHFLQGRCSACRQTVFNLKGDSSKQRERLKQLFDAHFQQVHAIAKK